MPVLRTATWLLVCVIAAAAPEGVQAAEEPAQGHAQAPGGRPHVEQELERAAKAAASGIARGLRAAEHGVRVGAAAAARGIERGAQATARAAEHVARRLERALPPAPPPGSERTGPAPGHGRPGHGDA